MERMDRLSNLFLQSTTFNLEQVVKVLANIEDQSKVEIIDERNEPASFWAISAPFINFIINFILYYLFFYLFIYYLFIYLLFDCFDSLQVDLPSHR
jgi:hypothetical protein